MKVENMTSAQGNKIANQFIMTRETRGGTETTFQSYDSVIVRITPNGTVKLDKKYWDYSVTTGKYRNQFLGESKKETQAKIDSGEYKLTNLN